MKKRKTIWRLWAKALGEKASKCDNEADIIALVRTFIFVTYLITNTFIIAGVIRHWNDTYEIPSHLHETKKEKLFKTNSSILSN